MSEKIRKKRECEPEKYDILQLDDKIKKTIIEESKKITDYKKQLHTVETLLADVQNSKNAKSKTKMMEYHEDLLQQQKLLEKKIEDIETNNMFAEYLCISEQIIQDYINLSTIPKNVSSFFSKPVSSSSSKCEVKYDEILASFLELAQKYIPIKTYRKEVVKKQICPCGNSKDFTYTENSVTCDECSLESSIYSIQTNRAF